MKDKDNNQEEIHDGIWQRRTGKEKEGEKNGMGKQKKWVTHLAHKRQNQVQRQRLAKVAVTGGGSLSRRRGWVLLAATAVGRGWADLLRFSLERREVERKVDGASMRQRWWLGKQRRRHCLVLTVMVAEDNQGPFRKP
ncbi:hypothetical protein AMTR_s00067p00167050 [Amborella trichopoda]|uniref:Uncharacterized protein n=1 Tax=Amborella trichopoda TaxID=13333 RepID=U5CZW4_AMBTC|nr:hypothetical protein AMTR_s00067p00167050 [Amborella trichopoda]